MEKQKKLYLVRNSKIHGRGIFAAHDIAKGTRVVQYFGEKISKAESTRRAEARGTKESVWIFELNQRYDLDGKIPNNPAKYINHSCNPNCEAENDHGQIWIQSIRDIKKGDELTYDYGFDMDTFWDHPCRCGSDNCIGYIVRKDQRSRVKRIIEKSKNKKKTVLYSKKKS
jgi:SET domain-containing protein